MTTSKHEQCYCAFGFKTNSKNIDSLTDRLLLSQMCYGLERGCVSDASQLNLLLHFTCFTHQYRSSQISVTLFRNALSQIEWQIQSLFLARVL